MGYFLGYSRKFLFTVRIFYINSVFLPSKGHRLDGTWMPALWPGWNQHSHRQMPGSGDETSAGVAFTTGSCCTLARLPGPGLAGPQPAALFFWTGHHVFWHPVGAATGRGLGFTTMQRSLAAMFCAPAASVRLLCELCDLGFFPIKLSVGGMRHICFSRSFFHDSEIRRYSRRGPLYCALCYRTC